MTFPNGIYILDWPTLERKNERRLSNIALNYWRHDYIDRFLPQIVPLENLFLTSHGIGSILNCHGKEWLEMFIRSCRCNCASLGYYIRDGGCLSSVHWRIREQDLKPCLVRFRLRLIYLLRIYIHPSWWNPTLEISDQQVAYIYNTTEKKRRTLVTMILLLTTYPLICLQHQQSSSENASQSVARAEIQPTFVVIRVFDLCSPPFYQISTRNSFQSRILMKIPSTFLLLSLIREIRF